MGAVLDCPGSRQVITGSRRERGGRRGGRCAYASHGGAASGADGGQTERAERVRRECGEGAEGVQRVWLRRPARCRGHHSVQQVGMAIIIRCRHAGERCIC